MKRFILFILSASVLGFASNLSAAETAVRDSVISILVDADCILHLDSLDRDRATVIFHNNEYYVYTANKVNISPFDKKAFMDKYLSVAEPNKGGLFFKRSDRKPLKDTKHNFNNNFIIGYDTGNFDRVKFDVCGRKFYLCRPAYHRVDTSAALIDTTGFNKAKAYFDNDTLYISKRDTLHSIMINEPKHSVFMSCTLNGKTLHDNQSLPIKDFNDPESDDKYKVRLTSYWSQLKSDNELCVKLAVLGETGAFDNEYVRTYHIKIKKNDRLAGLITPKNLIIAFVFVLIIALVLCFKNKKQNKGNPDSENFAQVEEHVEAEMPAEFEKREEVEKLAEDGKVVETVQPAKPDENEDIVYLKAKLAKTEGAVREYLDEIARLKEVNTRDYNEICNQNVKIDELKVQVNNQSETIRVCEEQIEGYRKQVIILNNKINDLNDNMAACEKHYDEEIRSLMSEHEAECRNLLKQIWEVQQEINKVTESWADDKNGIISFYNRYLEKIDSTVSVVLNDADPDSDAYQEISQMADSVNGYLSFKNKALDILKQTTLKIGEIEGQLAELLLSDVKYEKSWFNTIARLYA